ncbi:MAG: U32 family peptidase [Solobacterium sp.]|nr:U32 family peptidase [Solobacterium sp.]
MSQLIVYSKEPFSTLKEGVDEVAIGIEGLTMGYLPKYPLSVIKEVKCAQIVCNRFFFPEEMAFLETSLQQFKDDAVKSILFSDPAVYTLASKIGLVDKLVYDPSTLMTNSMDVSWWHKQGIKAVSISPLLTYEEIQMILEKVPNCELTIHGNILMAMSKRPLLSAYQEGLMGKEQLSITEENRDAKMPIYEDEDGTYVYSDYILTSFSFMKELKRIEGLRYVIHGEWMEEEMLKDTIHAYQAILNGEEMDAIANAYQEKYHAYPLGSGYYKEKTIK